MFDAADVTWDSLEPGKLTVIAVMPSPEFVHNPELWQLHEEWFWSDSYLTFKEWLAETNG